MADLLALLLLLATGWGDSALRRLGASRSLALAAGALVLAGACVNLSLAGAAPLRVNVGGTLPAAAMLAAAWWLPAAGGRLLAASFVAAGLLFSLSGWSGVLAGLALPLIAGGAALAVAGLDAAALLAAAAAPALAGAARWIVAYADGLPGTVWIGGGASFATMVLGVAAAGLTLTLAAGARGKHVSR